MTLFTPTHLPPCPSAMSSADISLAACFAAAFSADCRGAVSCPWLRGWAETRDERSGAEGEGMSGKTTGRPNLFLHLSFDGNRKALDGASLDQGPKPAWRNGGCKDSDRTRALLLHPRGAAI